MATVISQRELRNDSGQIMRGLKDGQTYIVTSRSEPVGELRPLRRRRLIDATAAVEMFAAAPPVDGTRFRTDLDALIDQDPEPRA